MAEPLNLILSARSVRTLTSNSFSILLQSSFRSPGQGRGRHFFPILL
jgi:hypothetical protein